MRSVKGNFTAMKTRLLYSLLMFLTCILWAVSCKKQASEQLEVPKTHDQKSKDTIVYSPQGAFTAFYTKEPVVVDGQDKDVIWTKSTWYAMNYNWIGSQTGSTDYSGKFKVAWDQEFLYLLVTITDDYLQPTLKDGLSNYWKGDYVEIFVDEDRSGGDHKYNHSAFAYHVTTDGHAIDLNESGEPVFLDHHVTSHRESHGENHTWEFAVKLYPVNDSKELYYTLSRKLLPQQIIGFSIAYGDNDGRQKRENFAGSKKTHGLNNDEGYTNADVFGTVLLVE